MKSSKSILMTLGCLIPLVSGCTYTEAVEPQPTRVYHSTQTPTARQYQTPTNGSFSQQQLDALLAPIALYPDSLLSHMLIASTYPLEVVEADRWAKNNRLEGDAAVNAVANKNWDPSVKALVAFPDVLKRMSEDLDWTQQLGDAFLEDEGRVMDSIQNLRRKADTAGSLNKTEHVKVVREEKVIYIEPAVERVVYVPVYDTRVVYGPWWWPDYPPVYWHRYSSHIYYSGSFYWGPSVHISSGFFYSSCHWRNRRVVIVDHHHYDHYYSHRDTYYRSARPWSHNPTHRRGVAYYNEPVRARYNSNRETRHSAWDQRQSSRDRAGVVSTSPNRYNTDKAIHRQARETAREMINTPNQREHNSSRVEQLQARMADRNRTTVESRTQGESRTQVDNHNKSNRRMLGREVPSSNEPREIIRQDQQDNIRDNNWRNRTTETQTETRQETAVDRQERTGGRQYIRQSESSNENRSVPERTQSRTENYRENIRSSAGESGRRMIRERE